MIENRAYFNDEYSYVNLSISLVKFKWDLLDNFNSNWYSINNFLTSSSSDFWFLGWLGRANEVYIVEKMILFLLLSAFIIWEPWEELLRIWSLLRALTDF